ncbi:hypothetical protein MCAV_04200 [[Mycoplasma] cavipharyngis]|uniref:P68 family surface lipoprotein n=1 Tax=[Mycoplasma] cavipharyngis TaxID=92757 RepID=UPI003703D683
MRSKKIKNFIKFKLTFISLSIISLTVIACSSNTNTNQVLFSIAQDKYYPLNIALQPLIPLYNQQQSNQANFLPVKLLATEETQHKSEFSLLNDTINKITAQSNDLPSLILNSSTSAATINSYGKLLDVSDVLKPSDFANEIMPLYTNVAGSNNHNRLYALPFNLSSTESLAINFPVLKFLVDQAVFNGATLQSSVNDPTNQTESIIAKLNKIDSEKNKIKIAKTVWNRFEYQIKNSQSESTNDQNNSLKNYIITDSTFINYDSLTEFSEKISAILKLKANTTVQAADKYANILSIDYALNVFKRRLWEETGSTINDYVWSYKNNPVKNSNNIVNYTILEQTKDGVKAQQFIKAFNQFVQHTKAADSTKKLRNVFYTKQNVNLEGDWASWLLRTFNTAIAIAPNVGLRQSVQSQLSGTFFASEKVNNKLQLNKNLFDRFAKYQEDVVWYDQYTKTVPKANSDQKLQTYIAGGSSLVPISINSKKDAALKNFLTWLYKGDVVIDNKTIKVSDYIQEKSSYFIPLVETFGTEAAINKEIAKLETKVEAAQKNNSDDQYILNTLILSIKDYLSFIKAQKEPPYKNNTKQVLFNPAGDINTVKINSDIDAAIKNLSVPNQPQINGDQLFQNLVAKKGSLIN